MALGCDSVSNRNRQRLAPACGRCRSKRLLGRVKAAVEQRGGGGLTGRPIAGRECGRVVGDGREQLLRALYPHLLPRARTRGCGGDAKKVETRADSGEVAQPSSHAHGRVGRVCGHGGAASTHLPALLCADGAS
eukprot:4182533-Prymnesium_polylepis.1